MTDPFYIQKAKQTEVIETFTKLILLWFSLCTSFYYYFQVQLFVFTDLKKKKKKQWRAFTLWLTMFSAITWLVSCLVRNTAESSSIYTMTNPAKVWRSYITTSVWAPFQSWSDYSSSALWWDKTRPHLWSQSSSPSQTSMKRKLSCQQLQGTRTYVSTACAQLLPLPGQLWASLGRVLPPPLMQWVHLPHLPGLVWSSSLRGSGLAADTWLYVFA